MTDPILDTLIFLMKDRRAPVQSTAAFRRMKHNSDLLPKLQTQLEVLLKAHGRFREVIYDTQGIHDDGVDALIRIPSTTPDTIPRIIGFQVKSFDDMNKPGYLKDLKAQHSDAIRKVQGLDYYVIMLFTDMNKHRDRVRNVMTEFRSTPDTEVVEPQFAYPFLHQPETRIDAIATRMVESSDLVFREALSEMNSYEGPSARALVVYLTVESVVKSQFEFYQNNLAADPVLQQIYSELRVRQAEVLAEYVAKRNLEVENRIDRDADEEDFDEAESDAYEDEEDEFDDYEDEEDDSEEDEPAELLDFQDQLAADLDSIETIAGRQDSSSGAFHFQVDQLRALSAVVSDAMVRFQYSRSDLMNYALDVMGIHD